MAEYTRMRNNVMGYPIYGLPYCLVFPLLDADGDPVTGLTCDSELSKNGNTAFDCHKEGVEIALDTATNKGMYYLDLTGSHTGTEMVADVVAVTVYTGVAADKATCMVLYPRKLPKILTGTVGATGNDTTHVHIPDGVAINDFYNGCVLYMNGAGNDEARMIIDYVASTKLATLNLALDAAPTASTSTYEVYMTEVAIASIIALWIGAIPNAVAGAANGLPVIDATGVKLTKTGDLTAGQTIAADVTQVNGAAQTATLDTIKADSVSILSKLLKYVQLLSRKDAAIATDNSTELTAINASGGSGAGAYSNQTDAEEALRDRGDAAWITGAGGDPAAIATAVWAAATRTLTSLGSLVKRNIN